MIALFFFLVCSIIGGVVLTSATVSGGQLADFQNSQQAYYATTSAAELMRDVIEGTEGTSSSSASGSTSVTWECTPRLSSNGARTMANWLQTAATSITGSASPTPSVTTSATVTASTDSLGVPPVSATFTMNADYSLTLSFQPQNYTGAVGGYRVQCTIPASLLYREDGSVEKIVWDHAVITKQGASGNGGA